MKRKVIFIMFFQIYFYSYSQLSVTTEAVAGKQIKITIKNASIDKEYVLFNVKAGVYSIRFHFLDSDNNIIGYYDTSISNNRKERFFPLESKSRTYKTDKMTDKPTEIVKVEYYLENYPLGNGAPANTLMKIEKINLIE